MNKKYWICASVALMVVVTLTVVFGAMYSAATPVYAYSVTSFNFSNTENIDSNVISTYLIQDNNNKIVSQTKVLNTKFSFAPNASFDTRLVLVGDEIDDEINYTAGHGNFVAIPVKIKNNMCANAKYEINLTNISNSHLVNVTYFKIYRYLTNGWSDAIGFGGAYLSQEILPRTTESDILIVVYASDLSTNVLDSSLALCFKLNITMTSI